MRMIFVRGYNFVLCKNGRPPTRFSSLPDIFAFLSDFILYHCRRFFCHDSMQMCVVFMILYCKKKGYYDDSFFCFSYARLFCLCSYHCRCNFENCIIQMPIASIILYCKRKGYSHDIIPCSSAPIIVGVILKIASYKCL